MATKQDINGKDFDAGDFVWVYCKVYATSRGGMPGDIEPTNIVVDVVAPNGVGEVTKLDLHSSQVTKA